DVLRLIGQPDGVVEVLVGKRSCGLGQHLDEDLALARASGALELRHDVGRQVIAGPLGTLAPPRSGRTPRGSSSPTRSPGVLHRGSFPAKPLVGAHATDEAEVLGFLGKEAFMKAVYFVSRGVDDPTSLSVPLHLAANGSIDVGHDVSV